MANNPVYLNGRYLPVEEAHISVLDRGFLFGDGVYEVIPAYRGRLFEFESHLARLENSLAAVRIDNPHTPEEWRGILAPLLEDGTDQYVYLQITRGAAPKRDHLFPENVPPTVFAMSSPIPPYPERDTGIRAVCLEDSRWDNCHVKAITLLANVLLRQEAAECGGAEAVLVKNGFVTEGSSSNVFAVLNGVLVTPPLSRDILPGITREVILKICRESHISCREQLIAADDLRQADEIWIASSVREIVPVVELDGRPVGGGKPGLVWQKVNRLFQAYKQSVS
ncbi:D-amino acid aminotransferase [Candidatus Methylomicrobium oryzae]|uniref:D-amino acid aminotransferase n=1 Tax=Candidatus Methylomicrobium oryzae TaxID=2802053 RepID=UPI0019219BA7|nr:D-amino acid aminotransferase [Methylomicrobium sp. RS1]MBL1263117.1 D-amino acid aminotransferase [Methylomicrobium sp. RS1]